MTPDSIAQSLPQASRQARADATKKDKPSPMMDQFLRIKAEYPECLLFYRMGDFYEMFFEDAQTAAAALEIALTKRGQYDGADVPMCGVPVHTAEAYLAKLIGKGFKVAVCEQIEDPAEARKRGSKAVVERAVVRLVTPGTLTEEVLLDARKHNYLAALAQAEGRQALAWLDISTGDFSVKDTDSGLLEADLARLRPGELLISERLAAERAQAGESMPTAAAVSPLPANRFDSIRAERRLKEFYGVTTLEGFGLVSRAQLAACGAVLDYVIETQKGQLPPLRVPQVLSTDAHLLIDAATRRNLELTTTLAGNRKGSLLDIIDRTLTGGGARLLDEWLNAPLTDPAAIGERHNMVQYFFDDRVLRDKVREIQRQTPDIARALPRLKLGRGSPRDLAAIRDGLDRGRELRRVLHPPDQSALTRMPAAMKTAWDNLGGHDTHIAELQHALADDLPVTIRDGGFIRAGYHAPLDEQRALRNESRRVIAAKQLDYQTETGISGLRIRHNRVLGYYIEVRAGQATPLMAAPLNERFIHRQTMAGNVRFTTVELSDLDQRIARAADTALALELTLFGELGDAVVAAWEAISQTARALALFDTVTALASLAAEHRHVRPIVDDSLEFKITGGRHPVVEAALQEAGGTFLANDCDLARAGHLWLVTGPNMAGKSTFLRQNALIAILAQMGAFVPAVAAHIGVLDRLFSRVGASDDLARGRSTFMVEMVETAAILNLASTRSLVILDEVGRGTSTFDGLSIAWATLEHLHSVNRSRTLFATHYHELTALAETLDALVNVTMRVKEWEGEVIFLHDVTRGSADRSYGIQVAKLAGLPAAVLARAGQILDHLEADAEHRAVRRLADDLPLFSAVSHQPAPQTSELERHLNNLNPDEATPREALEILYRLKALVGRHAALRQPPDDF